MDFLDFLLWNALEASVLAVAIGLLLKIVRLGAPLRHCLWLLVIAKLLVPPLAVHSVGLSGGCAWSLAQLKPRETPSAPDVAPGTITATTHLAAPDGGGTRDGSSPAALVPAVEDSAEGGWDAAVGADDRARATVGAAGRRSALEVEPRLAQYESAPAVAPDRLLPPLSPSHPTATETAPARPDVIAIAAPVGSWFTDHFWLVLWALGSAFVALRHAAGTMVFHRRLGRARPASTAVDSLCRALARRMSLDPPPVRVVDDRVSPLVWSLGRPRLVLPAALLERGDEALLRSVMAHELAHVKRRDHRIAWLEIVASCLYWWLPTFWWARREMRQAADLAADAWAVWTLDNRSTYARSLLDVVEWLQEPSLPTLGQGMGQRQTIARRLTMIMQDARCHRLSTGTRLVALCVGVLVLPASPLRVDGMGQEPRPLPNTPDTPDSPDRADSTDVADEPQEPVDLSPARKPAPYGSRRTRSYYPKAGTPGDEGPGVEERLERLERALQAVLERLEGLPSQATTTRTTTGRAAGIPRKGRSTSRRATGRRTTSSRTGPVPALPAPALPPRPAAAPYASGANPFAFSDSARERELDLSDEEQQSLRRIEDDFEKRLEALREEFRAEMTRRLDEIEAKRKSPRPLSPSTTTRTPSAPSLVQTIDAIRDVLADSALEVSFHSAETRKVGVGENLDAFAFEFEADEWKELPSGLGRLFASRPDSVRLEALTVTLTEEGTVRGTLSAVAYPWRNGRVERESVVRSLETVLGTLAIARGASSHLRLKKHGSRWQFKATMRADRETVARVFDEAEKGFLAASPPLRLDQGAIRLTNKGHLLEMTAVLGDADDAAAPPAGPVER